MSEIIHRKHSSVSHVSQSSRRHVEQCRCMQRRRHTLRTTDTPTHRHTTHSGGLSRTIGHRTANTSPHRRGEAERSHTLEQRRHLTRQRSLDVAGALPTPTVLPFQRRRAATRRAEPVSAGDLGAARDAGMRDGSVGSVPKADRLGCELRQPVGGRDGWPRAGGGEGVRR